MISYIGGKYRMAKWIYEYIPQNIELYAEIFGGAFWTYLRSDIYKIPTLKEVHYNDFNRLMVNMFSCSRTPEKFSNYFKHIKSQDKELFSKYLEEVMELEKNNDIDNIKIPDMEIGYKYPYLLTQVFSGVGLKPKTKMQDLKGKYTSKFEAFRKRLNNEETKLKLKKITDTHNLDFEKAVEKLDSETSFLYFDPPYYDTENYYSFHEFGREDHLRLANVLKNMKGLWALSYYDFPELSEWFPKDKYVWVEKEFSKAASAKKGIKQNKGTELLIMNYTLDEKNIPKKIN
jgi:DNA adenine methylase